jgi:hypothetical protein
VPRPARRPLDPTELSWIIELKILGKLPIRMFPPMESALPKAAPEKVADVPPPEEAEGEVQKRAASRQ